MVVVVKPVRVERTEAAGDGGGGGCACGCGCGRACLPPSTPTPPGPPIVLWCDWSVGLAVDAARWCCCLPVGGPLLVVGYEGRRRDRPANDAANGQQQQGSVCASVCMEIRMGRQHLLKGGRLGPSKEHACTQHRKQGTRGKSGRGVGDASAKAKLTRKRRGVCVCVCVCIMWMMRACLHWGIGFWKSTDRGID